MPQLKVCGGKPETFFAVYCPVCGRDGLLKFKSAYLALKDWNEMQQDSRDYFCRWRKGKMKSDEVLLLWKARNISQSVL